MYSSGLKPISSNLYGIMKSQEEGRKNVGRETLWRRKMKRLWTESVLYFHMSTYSQRFAVDVNCSAVMLHFRGLWHFLCWERRSASSEAQAKVDGAQRLHPVVGQRVLRLHLFALVDEPLLALRHPLPALDPALEVAHGLVGCDVVGAGLALLVPEEHLDHGQRDQQRHRGAGLQAAVADGPGVVAELDARVAQNDQLLPLRGNPELLLDLQLHGAHRVLGVHAQAVGDPVQHLDGYLHYDLQHHSLRQEASRTSMHRFSSEGPDAHLVQLAVSRRFSGVCVRCLLSTAIYSRLTPLPLA
ncbi:hypothetical protein EYF80_022770 [Liparis tanakae]|uniref:Uncharacterized protein n=1 Tax=Liparis tanakae TaxID=230148 RepID=A0A4Z2HMM0_9TELE|nr:hypothetical protein EYF80_022770 [Liparis tanakae]